MDRQAAAAILRDAAITRIRTDVPADVVEAIGVALAVIAEISADLVVMMDGGDAEAAEVAAKHRQARADFLARAANRDA